MNKIFLKGGLIGAAIATILVIYATYFCEGGLVCLGSTLLVLSPGLYVSKLFNLGANVIVNVFGNILFYFIIGGLIGLLINKKKWNQK